MFTRTLAGEEGGVLLVEGPSGVGKTALLGALREHAEASGLRVLGATGGELEGGFPFGVVRQLFDRVVRREVITLEGPARHAATALGLLEDEGTQDATTQETLYGLYWLVAELAEERPVLLAVDDAHWVDHPSIEFLEYLARRVADLALDLVIATRPQDHGADIHPLRRIARLSHATQVRLQELTPDAVARLVRERLGEHAHDRFCRACHEATAGNPFLVLELLRQLAEEGVDPSADQIPRVAQASPDTVRRAVLVRLTGLPKAAARLAEALAILGKSAPLRHAAALAALSAEAATDSEEGLLAADIIRPAGDSIAFAHPLVREVIYADLSPGRRKLHHARAAAILREAAVPADEIVPHLLASDPTGEPWRIETLRGAARSALRRGVPDAAVNALRRVLVESRESSEDPAFLGELGSAEMMAGALESIDHLQQAFDRSEDPNQRGVLARKLAQGIVEIREDMPSALPVLERVLGEATDLDRDLALRLEADALSIARLYPDTRRRADARLSEFRRKDLPEGPAASPLLANLALHALESTEHANVVARLAEQALEHATSLFRESGWVFSFAANALTWVDSTDAARGAWDEALEEARRSGSLPLAALALAWRGHLLTRIGELDEAEADLRAMTVPYGGPPSSYALAYRGAFTADILLERGGFEEAGALLAGADSGVCVFVHSGRSRLQYARGRFEEAREAALACGEMLAWRGGRESPGVIPWRSEAAVAMAALGERDEAARLASEELELARAQGVPRAIGMALRALGLIGDPGLDRLEEAVKVLEGSGSRIEFARALVDLGAAMRRARRRADAREPLGRGMDLAHRCGAAALEERAREELLATGARPRRYAVTGVEALTPTELRVARLAAEGRNNREIAQGLFVSMSTVGTHLGHAYQKLQIEGRHQLAEVL